MFQLRLFEMFLSFSFNFSFNSKIHNFNTAAIISIYFITIRTQFNSIFIQSRLNFVSLIMIDCWKKLLRSQFTGRHTTVGSNEWTLNELSRRKRMNIYTEQRASVIFRSISRRCQPIAGRKIFCWVFVRSRRPSLSERKELRKMQRELFRKFTTDFSGCRVEQSDAIILAYCSSCGR